MTITANKRIAPGEVSRADAQRALDRVLSYVERCRRGKFVQVGPETGPEDTLTLPRPVLDMLTGILSAIVAGKGVQVMPYDAELTTQQAADFLNVSRPYLIKLLETDQIEYRRVGKHRRIRFDKLVAYKAGDDAERREAADELSRLGQELGGD